MPVTIKATSLVPTPYEVYWIQFCDKFCQKLEGSFLQVFWFSQPIKLKMSPSGRHPRLERKLTRHLFCFKDLIHFPLLWGPLWLYGSCIYSYLCNQCLSPLTLWFPIPLRRGVLNTTLCDKMCQWLPTGSWFSPATLVSSTNKTDCNNITEILLKVALDNKTLTPCYVLY